VAHSFDVNDVLAEVADTPDLFNALSPQARAYLLQRPAEVEPPPPVPHMREQALKALYEAAAVVAEIVETPDIFNALSLQAREFLLGWL